MLDYKKATKEQLKEEYKRLSKLVNDNPMGTKKEFYHLPEILGDGEEPLAVASGLMDNNTWLITLTNRRVIFLDKGMMWGVKQIDVNLADIVSVGGKTGMLLGEILIGTNGQNYTIKNVFKAAVVPFTNLVNSTRDKNKSSSQNVQTPAPVRENDLVSQLERLALLREKGILTDEEFSQQKAKLLNG